MNNDEDIKLNYKFISTLKMCKNDDKNKPYNDYQEFYEIVKDKKRSGDYNLCDIKNIQNVQSEREKDNNTRKLNSYRYKDFYLFFEVLK